MTPRLERIPYICARCRRSQARLPRSPLPALTAPLSTSTRQFQQQPARSDAATDHNQPAETTTSKTTEAEEGGGAMSRRLRDLSEENLATGGRSVQNAVEEAGFDEELKQQQLNRIADANFRNKHPAAFALADMPTAAGKGTRDMAAAQPWTGTESIEDATLRMLTDAHKPLRGTSGGAPRIPTPMGVPIKVSTGKKPARAAGARLANARDKSSMYSFLKDDTMAAEDKEKFRRELKERFSPGARAVPATIQGLASLANERIEDAIARGQFKNLPRGKKLDRDYNMSSPFIDTTSYFLNKIIKKQEIVPPWIEKQQELVSTATKFRARLRNDWRRHAARTISSQGGPLEAQIRRAEQYAAAEAVVNPPPKMKVEKIDTVDGEGHVSQITLSGELQINPDDPGAPAVETITVTEGPPTPASLFADGIALANDAATSPADGGSPSLASDTSAPPASDTSASAANASHSSPTTTSTENPYISSGAIYPFRDPSWESAESSYHTLCITNLNALTRSYNLMAPQLAKKPYFSLDRELRACFADVAPQLPGEIRTRATAPKVRVDVVGHREGGVLEKFSREERVRVYDERKPQYGFKQFWKDLWAVKA